MSEKIISEAEKQSTSANKLFLEEKIISSQKDSLLLVASDIENKLLLDSLMYDADADDFISQFNSLPVVHSLTADTVVCSQPLSADLPNWPTPPTDKLDPGSIHGLHTGTSTPAATTTTTLLQQHDVNTLALSLDSHHSPLVPTATTATTQPTHPAYSCSYSQSVLGVHSTATTGLVQQLPTSSAYSQPSITQPVYTQPSLCQSSSMSTAAVLLPHTQPPQPPVLTCAVNADTLPSGLQPALMSPAVVHSAATQPGLVHPLDAQTACTQPPLLQSSSMPITSVQPAYTQASHTQPVPTYMMGTQPVSANPLHDLYGHRTFNPFVHHLGQTPTEFIHAPTGCLLYTSPSPRD